MEIVGMAFPPYKKKRLFLRHLCLSLGFLCIYFEVPSKLCPYPFGWQELFLDLYIVCAVIAIFPKAIRRFLRFIVSIVMYATTIADVFCFVNFNKYFDTSALRLIKEATKQETQEFINNYITIDLFTTLLGQVFILLALHIIWGSIMTGIDEKKKGKHNMGLSIMDERLETIGKAVNPIFGLGVLGVLVIALWNTADNKKLMASTLAEKNWTYVATLSEKAKANLYLPIYRVLFSFYSTDYAYKEYKSKQKQARKQLAQTELKEVTVDSCTFKSRNIILIIGGSYNKHHSQLFGYNKTTTPKQAKFYDTGYVVTLTDALASTDETGEAIKSLFTVKTNQQEQQDAFAVFPQYFKKAGYHITYLSNRQGDEEGCDFLSNNSLFDTRNSSTHPLDEGLLADYDTLKSQNTDKQLTIIHLMGQQKEYSKRYPSNRQFYHQKDYQHLNISDAQRTAMAHYDNATRYNDSVVACVMSRVYYDDAIVIYVPDHGELVAADSTAANGDITAQKAKELYEVPAWVWCSEKYAKEHPDIFKQLWMKRKTPLMTDALAHTLLYLAGIQTPDYKPELDFLNGQYNEKRPRLLEGKQDYDKLIAQP